MNAQELKNIYWSFFDQLKPEHAEKAKANYDEQWAPQWGEPTSHEGAVNFSCDWVKTIEGFEYWNGIENQLLAKTYPLQLTPQVCKDKAKEHCHEHMTTNSKMPAHEWFKYLKPEHREAALKLENDMGVDGELFESLEDALYYKHWGDGQTDINWAAVHVALVAGTYHHTPESQERMATEGDMERLEELVSDAAIFPSDDEERQKYPLAQTDLFFPDADAAFSNFCLINQQKHSPGTTNVTWAEEKSVGDGSQLRRHLLEFSKAVKDGDYAKADIEIRAVNFRGRELAQRWIKKMPPFDNL